MIDPMTDPVTEPVQDAPIDHDHAWSRVQDAHAQYAVSYEYRCDLCSLTWSM